MVACLWQALPQLLTAKGYRAEGFTPVDLFPQTAHCEVVGALTRSQKSKG